MKKLWLMDSNGCLYIEWLERAIRQFDSPHVPKCANGVYWVYESYGLKINVNRLIALVEIGCNAYVAIKASIPDCEYTTEELRTLACQFNEDHHVSS